MFWVKQKGSNKGRCRRLYVMKVLIILGLRNKNTRKTTKYGTSGQKKSPTSSG
jgi:hypothetical protein